MSTTPTEEEAETPPRWGMVVDVNRCVGCQTCTIACKHWNDTGPGVQWRSVLDIETGTYPDVSRLFLVVGCQHCAEPPCVPVCPTGATRQREDGLVTMDHDTCIGCAYCAVACPYQARTIVHDQDWYYGEETLQEAYVRHDDRLGTAQKCTFCVDRVDDGLARGLTPGVDPDATPACASACIADAINFGDFNDPASPVSRLSEEGNWFSMHEELGTEPQIRYRYTTPAVPGLSEEPNRAATGAGMADLPDSTANSTAASVAEPAAHTPDPLLGRRQVFWDWRAAMNWCFGGLASGLAAAAGLSAAFGALDLGFLWMIDLLAGALMAVGLFSVWMKIGRRFRAWRALWRPQTSWMSRELYSALAFYAGLALLLAQRDSVAAASLATGVTTGAALVFLLCQAMILYRAVGIPAWRAPTTPLLIFVGGLGEGVALLLLAALALSGGVDGALVWVLVGLLGVSGMLWAMVLVSIKRVGVSRLPAASARILRRCGIGMLVFGTSLPILLCFVANLAPQFAPAAIPLAAALVVIGGAGWKYAMVVRAGYEQGFALPRMPQRGSGNRAAPLLG